MVDFMTQREINWKFNPTAAPNFGGSWEHFVQSSKCALRIVLNKITVSDGGLSLKKIAAIAEVEALLNGRPLTNVPMDPGRASPNLAPAVISDQDLSVRRRWKIA